MMSFFAPMLHKSRQTRFFVAIFAIWKRLSIQTISPRHTGCGSGMKRLGVPAIVARYARVERICRRTTTITQTCIRKASRMLSSFATRAIRCFHEGGRSMRNVARRKHTKFAIHSYHHLSTLLYTDTGKGSTANNDAYHSVIVNPNVWKYV